PGYGDLAVARSSSDSRRGGLLSIHGNAGSHDFAGVGVTLGNQLSGDGVALVGIGHGVLGAGGAGDDLAVPQPDDVIAVSRGSHSSGDLAVALAQGHGAGQRSLAHGDGGTLQLAHVVTAGGDL